MRRFWFLALLLPACSLNPQGEDPGVFGNSNETSASEDGAQGAVGEPGLPNAMPSASPTGQPPTPMAPAAPGGGLLPGGEPIDEAEEPAGAGPDSAGDGLSAAPDAGAPASNPDAGTPPPVDADAGAADDGGAQ